jgi:hypothetical protein
MSIFIDPMPLADFERLAQQAYAEAEEGEDTYRVGRMTMVILWNYPHRGLVRERRQWVYRLMEFGRERRDYRSQGMALWLLGWLDIVAEEFTSALRHGEECRQTALAPYDRQIGQLLTGYPTAPRARRRRNRSDPAEPATAIENGGSVPFSRPRHRSAYRCC